MKKPTPSEWAKISKQIHSLSDIITAGYIHLTQQNNGENFEVANLSGYTDHTDFADALRYCMGSYPNDFALARDFEFEKEMSKPKEKVCDCGTWKTYGKKSPLSIHSSWCGLRN